MCDGASTKKIAKNHEHRVTQKSRRPLMIGWEAACANAVPALVIQAIMLALLIAYYTNDAAFSALNQLADYKRTHGLGFVIVASVMAGALIPEIFLILFFQRGRPNLRNLRNLAFTIPVWGFDGSLVDLLYRGEAGWLGDVVTLPVVTAKICIDQFGYNPLFAAPFGVLTYEWKNSGISLRPVRDLFTWEHYRDKIIPTLLATWAVWIPLMAIIYSLAARASVSAFRTGAFVLGPAFDLYDESVRGKGGSRCAAGAVGSETELISHNGHKGNNVRCFWFRNRGELCIRCVLCAKRFPPLHAATEENAQRLVHAGAVRFFRDITAGRGPHL